MTKIPRAYLPCDIKLKRQGFGDNHNSSYAEAGLKGHTAEDWAIPLGSPIYCLYENSYVYSTLNRDNPDLTRYRAVYTIIELGNGMAIEASYGHLDDIYVKIGTTIQPHDIIGTCGNTGPVYSDGKPVTLAERKLGKGAHLHGVQSRLCRRVLYVQQGKRYLVDGHGVLKKDGYYYEVVDYDNGYNGCIPTEYNDIQAKHYKAFTENLKAQVSIYEQVVGLYRVLVTKSLTLGGRMNYSTTIGAVIVNILSMVLPKIGITIGTDELTSTMQVIITIVTGLWIWYQRVQRGDVTPLGKRK